MTGIIHRIFLAACLAMASMGFSFDAAAQEDRMFSDYLTPQMFGAKGDGKRDDTDALRKALYESSAQGKILYFPSGAKYKVTGTLNFYRGTYQDLKFVCPAGIWWNICGKRRQVVP